ncbi:MAG: 4-alpha-glucanotransferase [Bacteroidota bacterium]
MLLHITSLPSPYGIGDLGPSAYRFADLLASMRQRIWQVLPIVPVGYGYSPYASPSTFAGNALIVSPDRLREQGLLTDGDLADLPDLPDDCVDYPAAEQLKEQLLRRAYERFAEGEGTLTRDAFEAFCEAEADWLDDYALFMALKTAHHDAPWTAWDEPLRQCDAEALAEARITHADAVAMRKFWQFLFAEQWAALRSYCHNLGVHIFGDIPIYVAHDSADVWANPELFFLEANGQPTVVSGVPPDYFSETGQRWGNPIYRWDVMRANGYAWWTRRFASAFRQLDLVRLDHFRGFEAFWEVPANEATAVNGRWVDGPGANLFDALHKNLGDLPLIAENLGVITSGVTELMERYQFPGMAILQFAFDHGSDDGFLPHNYPRSIVAYTGTHDNAPLHEWWSSDASTQNAEQIQRARSYASTYLGLDSCPEDELHWAFIRALMGSVANLVITPVQDVLGLGGEGRMNTPGTTGVPNWCWRMRESAVTYAIASRLRDLTACYGRAASDA